MQVYQYTKASFYAHLFISFYCFNAPYQFTQLPNSRPLIFGLKPFGFF